MSSLSEIKHAGAEGDFNARHASARAESECWFRKGAAAVKPFNRKMMDAPQVNPVQPPPPLNPCKINGEYRKHLYGEFVACALKVKSQITKSAGLSAWPPPHFKKPRLNSSSSDESTHDKMKLMVSPCMDIGNKKFQLTINSFCSRKIFVVIICLPKW